jgi:preprotein translocase subunit SecE
MKNPLSFLKESKDELTKVVWPTRKQTIEMTIVVIVVVLIVSFYLGGIDYLLTKGMTYLLNK